MAERERERVQRLWELECVRSRGLDRRIRLRDEEARYSADALRAAELHTELRVSLLERKSAGLGAAKVQTDRMLRLRNTLLRLEQAQSSRKDLVLV